MLAEEFIQEATYLLPISKPTTVHSNDGGKWHQNKSTRLSELPITSRYVNEFEMQKFDMYDSKLNLKLKKSSTGVPSTRHNSKVLTKYKPYSCNLQKM